MVGFVACVFGENPPDLPRMDEQNDNILRFFVALARGVRVACGVRVGIFVRVLHTGRGDVKMGAGNMEHPSDSDVKAHSYRLCHSPPPGLFYCTLIHLALGTSSLVYYGTNQGKPTSRAFLSERDVYIFRSVIYFTCLWTVPPPPAPPVRLPPCSLRMPVVSSFFVDLSQ